MGRVVEHEKLDLSLSGRMVFLNDERWFIAFIYNKKILQNSWQIKDSSSFNIHEK